MPPDFVQIGYYAIATAGAIVSIVAGFWAWGAKQAVKSANISSAAAKVEPIERELMQLRERCRACEQAIASQPTVNMVHSIQLALAELKGQMGVIGTEVKSAASSASAAMEATNRLEEYFIQKGMGT